MKEESEVSYMYSCWHRLCDAVYIGHMTYRNRVIPINALCSLSIGPHLIRIKNKMSKFVFGKEKTKNINVIHCS